MVKVLTIGSNGQLTEVDVPVNSTAIAWLPLTLATGWTVPAGFAAPQYRLVTGNRVALKGACSRTLSLLVNGLITTLPAGFRPLENRSFVLAALGSTIVNVTVQPNGEIQYTGSNTLTGGATQVALEIEFDAEQ